jgi:hypothetical protein
MDKELLAVVNGMISAGGMGLLLVAALKWLVGDYFKKAEENRKLEKEAVDSRITDLRNVAGDIKLEVSAMKERILHTEKVMVQAVTRLGHQSEKFNALTSAFEGFVKTSGERLKVVEVQADQVIRIGQMMAARIKASKPNNE